jgi:hypothetical protein
LPSGSDAPWTEATAREKDVKIAQAPWEQAFILEEGGLALDLRTTGRDNHEIQHLDLPVWRADIGGVPG